MRSHVLSALALGILAACATNPDDAASPGKISKDEVAQANTPLEKDSCGSAARQALVGKNKSEIPPAPAGANWRVACTTCAVTLDYRPDRLNIFFDEQTGEIKQVRCG
jgi:Peptidase inhibitor I78 family